MGNTERVHCGISEDIWYGLGRMKGVDAETVQIHTKCNLLRERASGWSYFISLRPVEQTKATFKFITKLAWLQKMVAES